MSSTRSADPVVAQLISFLRDANAHVTFEDAVENFPEHLRGVAPAGLPHSAWQLVEHLRIAQRDILDFSAPPAGGYQGLKWPEQYWPMNAAPPSPESWTRSLDAIRADRDSFIALLTQPGSDLHTPFPWGEGQTLLREALLIIDHNSYHTGELVLLRRALGDWNR